MQDEAARLTPGNPQKGKAGSDKAKSARIAVLSGSGSSKERNRLPQARIRAHIS